MVNPLAYRVPVIYQMMIRILETIGNITPLAGVDGLCERGKVNRVRSIAWAVSKVPASARFASEPYSSLVITPDPTALHLLFKGILGTNAALGQQAARGL